jgi:hypothetical protein
MSCAAVNCAQAICPVGSHVEVPAGQCCPARVMGTSQACNQAEANYSRDREALLGKYSSTPCKQDTDCQLVFESNACVTNCGEALPVVNAGSFETNISGDAMVCNAACPAMSTPHCAPQVAVCSNGTCTALPMGLPPP